MLNVYSWSFLFMCFWLYLMQCLWEIPSSPISEGKSYSLQTLYFILSDLVFTNSCHFCSLFLDKPRDWLPLHNNIWFEVHTRYSTASGNIILYYSFSFLYYLVVWELNYSYFNFFEYLREQQLISNEQLMENWLLKVSSDCSDFVIWIHLPWLNHVMAQFNH